MKFKRDVLREISEKLLRHHSESADVCRELRTVNKPCKPQHEPRHRHNRDFYEKMASGGHEDRLLHAPKIIKDAISVKRRENLTEKRKHVLKVYKRLKDSGAKFGWGPDGV